MLLRAISAMDLAQRALKQVVELNDDGAGDLASAFAAWGNAKENLFTEWDAYKADHQRTELPAQST